MDVFEAIRTKRMIRRFADRPLEPEHLRRILEAGRHAGSSKNQQRWTFIVVEDRERLWQLSELGEYAHHLADAAVAIALVTPDPHAPDQPLSVIWDLGVAAQNMMLAAWELGIGSCPATVYEPGQARAILGYPADQWCEYILSFGYPDDPTQLTRPPKAGGRKSFDEVVSRETW